MRVAPEVRVFLDLIGKSFSDRGPAGIYIDPTAVVGDRCYEITPSPVTAETLSDTIAHLLELPQQFGRPQFDPRDRDSFGNEITFGDKRRTYRYHKEAGIGGQPLGIRIFGPVHQTKLKVVHAQRGFSGQVGQIRVEIPWDATSTVISQRENELPQLTHEKSIPFDLLSRPHDSDDLRASLCRFLSENGIPTDDNDAPQEPWRGDSNPRLQQLLDIEGGLVLYLEKNFLSLYHGNKVSVTRKPIIDNDGVLWQTRGLIVIQVTIPPGQFNGLPEGLRKLWKLGTSTSK